ncbi:AAA family ATPase [Bradyrhizobium sp. Y36]|uniref:AAA family ATPase n=1 Tax=Bradyrhizobium sp. Y36 TaxID=2035447 RepID=UPI0013043931|nr:AAA family ATPase [Bradyrhizobium sp. Y36]
MSTRSNSLACPLRGPARRARRTRLRAQRSEKSDSERAKILTKLESLSVIDDKTLVVDEASMTELPTVHAIAKRLVAGSRLLFFGDEAQLPPIGFGLVFHKLAQDPGIALRLTEVAPPGRSDRHPARRSRPVRPLPAFSEFAGAAAGVSFVNVDHSALDRKLDEVIVKLAGDDEVIVVTARSRVRPRTRASSAHSRRPSRRCEASSAAASRSASPSSSSRTITAPGSGRPARPIVVIDPDERTIDILFDGDSQPKRMGDEHLVDLDLAYAVTCHRMQGSSAKRVVIPIYESRLLNRS